MIYCKAKREAKRINKIVNQPCYVIWVKSKFIWFSPSTWFGFENVTQDYIDFKNYKGKIYFKIK